MKSIPWGWGRSKDGNNFWILVKQIFGHLATTEMDHVLQANISALFAVPLYP
jgi:hypothetical protein